MRRSSSRSWRPIPLPSPALYHRLPALGLAAMLKAKAKAAATAAAQKRKGSSSASSPSPRPSRALCALCGVSRAHGGLRPLYEHVLTFTRLMHPPPSPPLSSARRAPRPPPFTSARPCRASPPPFALHSRSGSCSSSGGRHAAGGAVRRVRTGHEHDPERAGTPAECHPSVQLDTRCCC